MRQFHMPVIATFDNKVYQEATFSTGKPKDVWVAMCQAFYKIQGCADMTCQNCPFNSAHDLDQFLDESSQEFLSELGDPMLVAQQFLNFLQNRKLDSEN